MSREKGVLLFSFNSRSVDYGKITNICALLVKKYLGLPIAVVTDKDHSLDTSLFDDIIVIESSSTRLTTWRNNDRDNYYELTPFKKTLVIDSDYLIFNDNFLRFFNSSESLILTKKALKTNYDEVDDNEKRLNPLTIDMSWATCFYFKKDLYSERFFELVSLIKNNYNLYYTLYRVKERLFRNDYVFSIARHILSDEYGDLVTENPYTLYTAYPHVDINEVKENGLILYDPSDRTKLYDFRELSVHLLNKKTILKNYGNFRKLFK